MCSGKYRFSLVVVYGNVIFSPMGVTKVFINYKFHVLSDENQNVQPRRSNLIKPLKNNQTRMGFGTVKHRGVAGVISSPFRLNNVEGLLRGRNYSARAVDKDMLGIYGGEGGENL